VRQSGPCRSWSSGSLRPPCHGRRRRAWTIGPDADQRDALPGVRPPARGHAGGAPTPGASRHRPRWRSRSGTVDRPRESKPASVACRTRKALNRPGQPVTVRVPPRPAHVQVGDRLSQRAMDPHAPSPATPLPARRDRFGRPFASTRFGPTEVAAGAGCSAGRASALNTSTDRRFVLPAPDAEPARTTFRPPLAPRRGCRTSPRPRRGPMWSAMPAPPRTRVPARRPARRLGKHAAVRPPCTLAPGGDGLQTKAVPIRRTFAAMGRP
jgi:hypothetical protein